MSFTYKVPVPSLKCISQETAVREGYAEITTPICPRTESKIFENIQRQLAEVGGVWIEHKAGCFAAGRKKRELLPLEALVDADDRRERKTGRADA